MRIAIFSDNFYPEISGISDSILTTGHELQKLGHTVVYVAPRYRNKDYKLTSGESTEFTEKESNIYRLPSVEYPLSPTGQSRVVLPLGSSFEFLKAFKPDIIHTHSPFGAGLEALIISRKLNVPLIGTNNTPIEKFVPSIFSYIARKYYSWYYNRCIFVSAPYEGLLQDMKRIGFKRTCKELPNPVLVETFTPLSPSQKNELKQTLKLPKTILLYTGRLAKEKHVDVVIRALHELKSEFPNLHFYITGHGSAQTELVSLAKKLTISDRVHFEGFVDNDYFIKIYQVSDIFVMMSTAETQSLSLMQAFATGIPAVVARDGALPYYTPETCGIVVTPNNVAELSKALQTLLHSPSLRETMGEHGKDFVKKFNPLTIATLWESLYLEYKKL